uniref:uncharacterized protein LOC120339900 n=1 Tax=Styela clava TaxID=7725 RepID=UPI001939E4CE|nr:uncharacterized protein LOC120339900 [Styela clava]
MSKYSMFSVSLILTITICHAVNIASHQKLDCSFESSELGRVKPTKCGYTRGWDGMLRGNWKVKNVSKDGKIVRQSGYFAYYEARRRPAGHSSKFVSPIVSVYDDMCVTFYYVNKGIKTSYPKGRSMLKVYFSPNGMKETKPLWISTERTSKNKWRKATVPLSKGSLGEALRGSLVFAAVRGESKRAYIAIDDIKVHKCKGSPDLTKPTNTGIREGPTGEVLTGSQFEDPNDLFRVLAAHRPVQTREFSLAPGQLHDATNPASLPASPRFPPSARVSKKRGKGRSRSHRRRKGKGNKKLNNYGVVYFTEEPGQQSTEEEPFVPTLIAHARPDVICDFMEYTQGLKKCLRSYFSMLKQHRSNTQCNAHYFELETCLLTAATKCVPSHDMTKQEVEEVVTDTLRNKFKTQRVYCFEEGAFVYPEFSLGSLPLQCTKQYFQQLTQCGGSFAGIFNFKHGDKSLCKEYFTANECQRRTTADECNFDTRSMLVYGLNLQYQFAHNPFCIDLPFSAWWPTS